MQNLASLSDETQVQVGTIIRLFQVARFDLQYRVDRFGGDAVDLDYYDYLLVDANVVAHKTFLLINVTLDNPNKGRILCGIKSSEQGILLASDLKQYFGSANVEISLNS